MHKTIYLSLQNLNKELLNKYREKSIERGKIFSKEKTVKEVEKMLVELVKN